MNPEDASRMELVAVVNSFNRHELLRVALDSLRETLSGLPMASAIVVYDAGSTDGSLELLAGFESSGAGVAFRLLKNPPGEPDSFSDGINRACELALREFPGLKWFFLFETDNWISGPGPLADALRLAETEPSLAAVGFTVRRHDGRPAGYGCRFPTGAGFMLGPQLCNRLGLDSPGVDGWQLSAGLRWRTCDVVYTSPILIRRAAWEQSAGLDAAAFPFADCDLDWAWRLRKMKWRSAVIETDGVVHDNRSQLSQWSESRSQHFHRARLRLLQRHGRFSIPLLKAGLLARHLGEFLVALVLFNPPGSYFRRLRNIGRLIRTLPHDYESAG